MHRTLSDDNARAHARLPASNAAKGRAAAAPETRSAALRARPAHPQPWPGSRARYSSRSVMMQEGSSPITGRSPAQAARVRARFVPRSLDHAGGQPGTATAQRRTLGARHDDPVAGGRRARAGPARRFSGSNQRLKVSAISITAPTGLAGSCPRGLGVAERITPPRRQGAGCRQAEPAFADAAQGGDAVAQVGERARSADSNRRQAG